MTEMGVELEVLVTSEWNPPGVETGSGPSPDGIFASTKQGDVCDDIVVRIPEPDAVAMVADMLGVGTVILLTQQFSPQP